MEFLQDRSVLRASGPSFDIPDWLLFGCLLNMENGGRWGLRNPEQLLAVIQGADALLAAGKPEAARALLAPFTGGGA